VAISANKQTVKSIFLRVIGLVLCVIPVTVSILCYFPAWRAAGGEVLLSGATLLLLCMAAVPLYKLISAKLRSPAAYTLWLIAFILFFLLSNIAEEMVVISFTGFIGNLLGAIAFKLAGGKNERT
jgi:chromate transport protein ChrA